MTPNNDTSFSTLCITRMVKEIEGIKNTNDKLDLGGETQFGLLRREIEDLGMSWPISYRQAIQIHKQLYWKAPGIDHLDMSPTLQWRMYCDCLHIGPRATIYLQRILNVANLNEQRWNDLNIDGDIGPKTAAAVNAFLTSRSTRLDRVLRLDSLVRAMVVSWYVDLCERRPEQEHWFAGWVNRLSVQDWIFRIEREAEMRRPPA